MRCSHPPGNLRKCRYGIRWILFFRDVLALDADGDGKVTPDEFRKGMAERFARVDADGDGVISRQEFEAYWTGRGLQPPRVAEIPPDADQKLAPQCAAAKAGKDDKLVIFNTQQAATNATVAIGSTELVTKAAKVVVEPGPEPLYLVLIAGERMIWQFEGATDRVKHAVLASIAPYDAKGTPVGATGLPADVVTIAPGGQCGRFWVNLNTRDGQLAERAQLLFGHRPDVVLGADSSLWKLRLPSGRISKPEQADFRNSLKIYQPDPILLHAKTEMLWFAAIVSPIEATNVIAGQPVKPYETLPGYAGLLQLILKGAVEHIEDNEFMVRRQIAFPIELHSSSTVITFRVPKGVPAPTGDPGNSKVIIE